MSYHIANITAGLPTAGASVSDVTQDAAAFWTAFGFDVVRNQEVIETSIPDGVVAFQPNSDDDVKSLWLFLNDIGPQPTLRTQSESSELWFYSLEKGVNVASIRAAVPSGITVYGQGDPITLPGNQLLQAASYEAGTIDELLAFTLTGPIKTDAPAAYQVSAEPLMIANPLEQYSLRGHLAELEAAAVDTRGLLGHIALAGQATIIYAPPGSGKTLITLFLTVEAINAGRVQGGNVYYVNADDSSSGVAAKMRLLEDVGAHMLVPGLQGFSTKKLLHLMQEMIETDTCRGVVIIVDTLKKVVDLMDKRDSRAFGQVVRECVAKGATFLGLAHTNKNARPNGKLVHAGTTDFVEDADAACVLAPLSVRTGDGEKVVQFEFLKRRGDNIAEAFAYADGDTGSYDELLASVRSVDPDNLDRFVAEAEERTDEPVIAAITSCIADGIIQKMALAHAAAVRAKVSARASIKVIERYQGDNREQHRWTYSVEDRGAKVYRLLNS